MFPSCCVPRKWARAASDISAIPKVRIKLAQVQRAVAQAGDVVMDGREIGSYGAAGYAP